MRIAEQRYSLELAPLPQCAACCRSLQAGRHSKARLQARCAASASLAGSGPFDFRARAVSRLQEQAARARVRRGALQQRAAGAQPEVIRVCARCEAAGRTADARPAAARSARALLYPAMLACAGRQACQAPCQGRRHILHLQSQRLVGGRRGCHAPPLSMRQHVPQCRTPVRRSPAACRSCCQARCRRTWQRSHRCRPCNASQSAPCVPLEAKVSPIFHLQQETEKCPRSIDRPPRRSSSIGRSIDRSVDCVTSAMSLFVAALKVYRWVGVGHGGVLGAALMSTSHMGLYQTWGCMTAGCMHSMQPV